MREALPFQYQGLERAQVAAKAAARFLFHFVARSTFGLSRSVSFGLPGVQLGGLFFVF